MAIRVYTGSRYQSFKDNGAVNQNGSVEFYEPDGTFTTTKNVYSDSGLSTSIGATVTLDAAGAADIWLNGNYDVIEKDSTGTTVDSATNINPDEETVLGSFNLVDNFSFENTQDGTLPTSWDVVTHSGGTVAIDTTEHVHGKNSLKFTSTGSGGGYITTSSYIDISRVNNLDIAWSMKSTVADIRNVVEVRFYDSSNVYISSTNVYDEDTNNNLAWSNQFTSLASADIPSNAVSMKLRIHGAHSSDVTSGSVWYDHIDVRSVHTKRFTAFILAMPYPQFL